MSTRLTQAAASAKQLGLVAAIIIPLLFAGRLTWGVISDATKPKPTPTPLYTNLAYSVLPRLKLPDNTPRSNAATIRLNTSDLGVPTVTYNERTVTIYKFKKRNTNFSYINNINAIGNVFGIPPAEALRVTPTLFRLSDPSPDGPRLDVDIQYYSLKYQYANPGAFIPIERGGTVDEGTAFNTAASYYNNVRTYIESTPISAVTPSDKTSFAYRDLQGQTSPVSSRSQANLTQIKIARQPYKSIPFVGPSTVDYNVSFTFTEERAAVTSGGANRPRLIDATIKYWPIEEPTAEELAVYPIRSITQAYADLSAGKGYILSPIESQETYLILRAYLAYYEPVEFMEYVTPVWVFEGDALSDSDFLFRAIVPAVGTGAIEE